MFADGGSSMYMMLETSVRSTRPTTNCSAVIAGVGRLTAQPPSLTGALRRLTSSR